MEKTLTIDGKQVTFKTTAATPLRYKAQFGHDFFADLTKLIPLSKINLKDVDEADTEQVQELFRLMDFDLFYNILWSMAKTADKSIPEPLEWLDQFEEFPLMDIFPQVQDLIMKNLQTTKKK
ncbi:hypothetical protein Pryu01_03061 [Paraliobacillus ryukyuensis]|uniref:Uncharacterized protein n=1 Tax=Paraliobacillus ryukyuensis TaxID=200904 RepID=A0A366DQD4_9BACI|nr:hypothetical protein [Paraliobacillus ryukyuensis]RBO92292.1 hypothetical protein DES48_11530 [Paraliobacillus ryukyuensis]